MAAPYDVMEINEIDDRLAAISAQLEALDIAASRTNNKLILEEIDIAVRKALYVREYLLERRATIVSKRSKSK